MRPDQRVEMPEDSKDNDLMTAASTKKNEDASPKINVDLTALIRSVQRSEGYSDCFRRNKGHCDQVGCAWRSYCLPFQSDAQQDHSK